MEPPYEGGDFASLGEGARAVGCRAAPAAPDAQGIPPVEFFSP